VSTIVIIAKLLAILVAAVFLGTWFLKEVSKSRDEGTPWTTPYKSIPGIMILISVFGPVIYWLITSQK